MADYITLLGAEDVRSAASAMQRAADEMRQAAGTIDHAMLQQRQFMEDWLYRFEQILRPPDTDKQNV